MTNTESSQAAHETRLAAPEQARLAGERSESLS